MQAGPQYKRDLYALNSRSTPDYQVPELGFFVFNGLKSDNQVRQQCLFRRSIALKSLVVVPTPGEQNACGLSGPGNPEISKLTRARYCIQSWKSCDSCRCALHDTNGPSARMPEDTSRSLYMPSTSVTTPSSLLAAYISRISRSIPQRTERRD